MKISVAVAPANALPSAFVVWRGLEESIRKAAAYGFDGVELALADHDQVDIERIQSLCTDYGIEISAISTGQVFASKGLYLTDPDTKGRQKAIDCLQGLIDVAAVFGKIVNIGRVRGMIADGETYQVTRERFVSSAQHLADYAKERDVEIIIEPVNRYEINFINSLEDAEDVLQAVGRSNVGLMPDVFHMNIEDVSITGELARYRDVISYVHFADSNRLSPGQGHLNFPELVNILKAINYDGWVAVECLPKPDPDTAARQAIDYLRQLIPDHRKERL